MKLKELKTLFKISIEQTLLEPLLKVGFKWKKSSMGFQRNKGDFSQSILFFLSPIKYYGSVLKPSCKPILLST